MELFVERLITTFSPEDHTKYGGTIALREASGMRVFSPFLCNAFEAASLTVAGRRSQNRSIEVAGHSRYVRTLRQLQKALYDPKDSKSTEVLVVVLLATIVEVCVSIAFLASLLIRPRHSSKRRKTQSFDIRWAVWHYSAVARHSDIAMDSSDRYLWTFDYTGYGSFGWFSSSRTTQRTDQKRRSLLHSSNGSRRLWPRKNG